MSDTPASEKKIGALGFRNTAERTTFIVVFVVSVPVLFYQAGLIGALVGPLLNGAIAVWLFRTWRYLVGTV